MIVNQVIYVVMPVLVQSLALETNLYHIGKKLPLIAIVSEPTATEDTGSVKLISDEIVGGIVVIVKLPLHNPIVTIPVVIVLYHDPLGIIARTVLPLYIVPVLPEERRILHE